MQNRSKILVNVVDISGHTAKPGKWSDCIPGIYGSL